MVTSKATTVDDYLASLPDERRAAIAAVRDVVNANLPAGYEEAMQYGMISWVIPFSVKPDTYNKQPLAIASLASQKNHMALYLIGVNGNKRIEMWFRKAFAMAGKTLDMGKSCVRFKTLDALPLPVIGEVITKVPAAELIAVHDAVHNKAARAQRSAKRAAEKKPAAKKSAKKAAAKKTAAKKTAAKKPAAKKPAAKKR
ncbi:MAG: DUF1801 domain-containing protein [Kofleriaceae bacterium]